MALTEHSNEHGALLQGNRDSIWAIELREPFARNCPLIIINLAPIWTTLKPPSGIVNDVSLACEEATSSPVGERCC